MLWQTRSEVSEVSNLSVSLSAQASIVSMPDSGFWPESDRSALFRGWFALQGSVTDGLPKHCKYLRTNTTKCLFPEYFADEIQTRLSPPWLDF